MKTLTAALTSVIAGLLALPLIVGGSGTATRLNACGDVAAILDTIRTQESGGDYAARSPGSSASGAYQMIDSTWAHWAAASGHADQFQHAWQAPPAVQDAAAEVNVRSILDTHHGDVTFVPLTWYYPAAIGDPTLMDGVPMPEAGNVLTPRQYQERWLTLYRERSSTAVACGATIVGDWALPVPKQLLDQNPDAVNNPHHDYPAWDFGIPVGTPIFAMRAGIVASVSTWPGNCYNDQANCVDKCGIGVSIQSPDGMRWIYCHASALRVALGDQVVVGQLLMLSGNTGHSSGAHLHLGLRIGGVDYCPQPFVIATLRSIAPPPPTTASCST
jgi:murein DD-endopeptidase MepM/ murein hydrolase activator NlpD